MASSLSLCSFSSVLSFFFLNPCGYRGCLKCNSIIKAIIISPSLISLTKTTWSLLLTLGLNVLMCCWQKAVSALCLNSAPLKSHVFCCWSWKQTLGLLMCKDPRCIWQWSNQWGDFPIFHHRANTFRIWIFVTVSENGGSRTVVFVKQFHWFNSNQLINIDVHV